MLTITVQDIPRVKVVEVLTKIRTDWELATDGDSLVDVQGSVGLILVDLVIGLALRPSEQVQVLGPVLQTELQNLLVVMPQSVVLEQ